MEYLFLRTITLILPVSLLSGVVDSAATFTFVNKCGFTVWPGILSNAGVSALSTTGFALRSGDSEVIDAPTGWGGRFWGRTYCSTQGNTGNFVCDTGDCGSGKVSCDGAGAEPPVTLAEFKLDGADEKDFYDISLVDGYNLPMLVVPYGGSGVNCTSAGCLADLNSGCPTQLRVDNGGGGKAVACKSACSAFGSDEHCCSGAYASPASCSPSQFSRIFKRACPQAYSYAYDDQTSTFTCTGADYTITFCPSPNTSQKSSSGGQTDGASPEDSRMIYVGASELSAASASTYSHVIVGAAAAVWWLCSHLNL